MKPRWKWRAVDPVERVPARATVRVVASHGTCKAYLQSDRFYDWPDLMARHRAILESYSGDMAVVDDAVGLWSDWMRDRFGSEHDRFASR